MTTMTNTVADMPASFATVALLLIIAGVCLASAAVGLALQAMLRQNLARIVAEAKALDEMLDDPCDDAARELAGANDGETMLVEFAGSVFTQAEINKLDAVRARRRAGAA